MNKLIKISLIIAISAFIFGCAHDKNMQTQEQDAYAISKKLYAPYCKGQKCIDKLGSSTMETEK